MTAQLSEAGLAAATKTAWNLSIGTRRADTQRKVAEIITAYLAAAPAADRFNDGLETAAKIAEDYPPRDDLLPLCNADMNAGAKRGMFEAAEEIAAAIRKAQEPTHG
jgi:hypothetical protein